ncbi:MAG TPA: tetratricopeptide repeat protein [Drouetiella sp.]
MTSLVLGGIDRAGGIVHAEELRKAADVSSIMDAGQQTEQRRTRMVDAIQTRYSKWLKKCSVDTRNQFLNAVQAKVSRDNRDKSTLMFRKIIDSHPEFEPAYAQLGSAYARDGRFKEALALCNKALELDSTDYIALRNRMYCHMMQKQYQNGVIDATCLLKLRPYDADVLSDRAKAYVKLGNRRAAQRDFADAKEAAKKNVSTGGGIFLSEQEQITNLKMLSNKLFAAPNDSTLLEKRATSLIAMSSYNEALDDIKRALAQKPEPIHQAYLLYQRARCNTALNKEAEALNDCESCIVIFEKHKGESGNWDKSRLEECYLLHADLCLAMQQKDRALKDCARYIQLFPNRTSGYLKRADAEVALNKNSEALADYEKVVQLNDGEEHAWLAIAQICENTAQYSRSERAYSVLIKMHPDVGDFYLARARVFKKQGKMQQALSDYDAMIKRSLEDPLGYEERAEIEVGLGQINKAKADLEKAIKASPEDASRLQKELEKLTK